MNVQELELEATVENLPQVLTFVGGCLEEAGGSIKAGMQVDIAVEEIFVNIAHYAYAPGHGPATIRVETEPGEMTITFIDSGMPYDPVAKEDPDTTLSAEERQIGGLGIFMVKELMDGIAYERKDGQNILVLKKKI